MRVTHRHLAVAFLSAVIASSSLTPVLARNAAAKYVLRISDLPKGYVSAQARPISAKDASGKTVSETALIRHGYITGYLTSYVRGSAAGPLSAASSAYLFRAASGARWSGSALASELAHEGFKKVAPPHLDDETRGFVRIERQGTINYSNNLITVRNRAALVLLDLRGPTRVVRFNDAVRLATVIAARIKS